MGLFVDASAIVAMIGREPEAATFADILDRADTRLTNATAIWEAARGVEKVRKLSVDEARAIVFDFVTAAKLTIVPIGREEAEGALAAHALFGKGVHPASLNFGDCFAYACARRHGAAILFKGDDFAQTDLPDATLI